MKTLPYILILYYSRHGAVKALAEAIAHGVESTGTFEARLRTVAPIANGKVDDQAIPESGDLYATLDDLRHCSGLAMGSAAYFGNMAAPLKHFLDGTTELWFNNALVDKPATVFTSTSSLHGGQETTLMSMMVPLLHQGMIILGTPYTEEDLHSTRTGGTPYGPTHVTQGKNDLPLSEEEKRLARYTGQRLVKIAEQLNKHAN